MSVGVDCTSPISPSALHAAGVGWIMRYLYSGNASSPSWKDCRPGEAQSYVSAGIVPVLNMEAGAADATGGYNVGLDHGRRASAQARGLGYPAGCTIYYSVDTDTDGASCADYFRGVHDASVAYQVGAYGSARVIGYLLDHGLADKAWQTSAWSGGARDSRAVIYQHTYNQSVGGVAVDLDDITGHTGGWGDVSASPPPTKPVTPKPVTPKPPEDIVTPADIEAIAQRTKDLILLDSWLDPTTPDSKDRSPAWKFIRGTYQTVHRIEADLAAYMRSHK